MPSNIDNKFQGPMTQRGPDQVLESSLQFSFGLEAGMGLGRRSCAAPGFLRHRMVPVPASAISAALVRPIELYRRVLGIREQRSGRRATDDHADRRST